MLFKKSTIRWRELIPNIHYFDNCVSNHIVISFKLGFSVLFIHLYFDSTWYSSYIFVLCFTAMTCFVWIISN